MRKYISLTLFMILIFAFTSINAQTKIVTDSSNEVYAKKKKKYDLAIKYKKGMKFERMFKLKVTQEWMDEETEGEFDEKNYLKTNITILDVKDDMPTELRIFFKDIVYDSNIYENNESSQAEKIVGHWVKVKKYDSKNYKITEKSEDYPNINCDLIDINGLTKYAFYDLYDFSDKSIAVGESFIFNYDCFLLDSDFIEEIDNDFKTAELSRDMKLKLEKVEKDGKSRIAYLKGEVHKKFRAGDYDNEAKFELKIKLDLTEHRCLKTYFEGKAVSMSLAFVDLYNSDVNFKLQIDNDYSKEKQKDEVDKDKKDDKD